MALRALYAVDTHFLGMDHFAILRRAAANALIGANHHVNSHLAMMCLSKYIQDPMLFVITNALRAVRRLYALEPTLAVKFIRIASSFSASVSFGPATYLCKYLRKLNLTINDHAEIKSGDEVICSLKMSPLKEFKAVMSKFWTQYAFSTSIDCKGIPSADAHVPLQLAAFSKLSYTEQKMIALNIVGGFQTNSLKNKWDKEVDANCLLCDQVDSRPHRTLHCEATRQCREAHPDACLTLTNNENWQYLPIVVKHEHVRQFQQCIQAIQLPEAELHGDRPMKFHRYFTDGACINPTVADARISSWAIVRDMAIDGDHALAMTQLALESQSMCPLLQVAMMGITSGRQTISRGELTAFTLAVESAILDCEMEATEIVTDSQYVINVVHFFETHDIDAWGHHIANFDLVKGPMQSLASTSVQVEQDQVTPINE